MFSQLTTDLKREKDKVKWLESRVAGGGSAMPSPGGPGGQIAAPGAPGQASDAWQRAKTAAQRQVQPPGVPVAGRPVVPQRAPPTRPGGAPSIAAPGGAESFESRNIEKDQLVKNVSQCVAQVKAHMDQKAKKGKSDLLLAACSLLLSRRGNLSACANSPQLAGPPGVTLGDDSTDPEVGKLIRQSFCDALVPVLNYGFKSFKLFGKHHFWDFLEKLLDDQLEKSNDGSFSVEKQSAKCKY